MNCIFDKYIEKYTKQTLLYNVYFTSFSILLCIISSYADTMLLKEDIQRGSGHVTCKEGIKNFENDNNKCKFRICKF